MCYFFSLKILEEEEISGRDMLVRLLQLFSEAMDENENEGEGTNAGKKKIEEIHEKDIVTTVYEGDLDGARKILAEKPHMVYLNVFFVVKFFLQRLMLHTFFCR